jgi:hypothetical protein
MFPVYLQGAKQNSMQSGNLYPCIETAGHTPVEPQCKKAHLGKTNSLIERSLDWDPIE